MANSSELSLWLEDALGSWLLPVLALALLGGVAGLYLLGWAGEEQTAAFAIALASLGAALLMVRPALTSPGPARLAAVGAALLTALAVLLTAIPTVWPGKPVFEGELGLEGDRIELPTGASGRLRLLVAGKLREGGEPTVTYLIAGAEPPVEGRLERIYRQVRVGRGGRGRVASDHTADWYDAVVPEGTKALTLRRVTGQLGGRLILSGHRPIVPAPWPWALSGVALLVAAVAEAWLGKKNAVAVPAGMALAFGLVVTANATPFSAVGPVLGAVVLGSVAGSVVGWVAGATARRTLAPRRE